MSPLREFISARRWARVGATEWRELGAAFPDARAGALVRAAAAAGAEVEQPFRGVAQHTFEELGRSLAELAEVYRATPELRALARKQVIAAKDRARFASRNPRTDQATRRRKAEMVEWLLVWLDDPAMFETWARARQARMTELEPGLLPPEHAFKEDTGNAAGEETLMPAIPDVSGEDRVKCDVCGGSGDCVECKGTGNGGQCFNCAGTGNCPQCQGTGLRKKKP